MASTTPITEYFRAWMSNENWHSGHDLDEQRFHSCMADLTQEEGSEFRESDFLEAFEALAELMYPGMDKEYCHQVCAKYATIADHICGYERKKPAQD